MNWKIDPAHSRISFSVRHMMISNVHGRFDGFSGSVDFDEAHPERTLVDVQIDAAGINTREAMRDKHLRSADFLDAETYPHLSFKSTRVEVLDSEHARLTGDLTIRDVTRPVVLDVVYSGQAKSPWGPVSAGFSASGKIHRKDWGLHWNQALETGGFLVGDDIHVNVELEIVKQAVAEPVAASS